MESENLKTNYRQAGKQQPGRLVKGHIQDAYNEKNSSSIPYKFETILYRNTNPKGFGTSAQRAIRNDDMAPGPGSYDSNNIYSRSNSTSMSKKGYGNGFVSQANRMLYRGYMNTGPGPGSYNRIENPFQIPHIIQHQKHETPEDKLKSKIIQADLPGPGYYNPDIAKTSNTGNAKVINSMFKSTTVRKSLGSNSNPPPGTYEIDRSIMPRKTFKHHLGTSNFMLPATKKMTKEAEDKETVNNILGKDNEINKTVPGPGYYFNTEQDEDEAALFTQKIQERHSHTFVSGNQTRFGDVIQKKVRRVENPGPGTYNPNELKQDRSLVSGAVFMSETARNLQANRRTFVGPTKYNPELLPKKSYHLNINKMWV